MTKKAVQRPVTERKKETGIYVSFIDFVHYGCFQQKIYCRSVSEEKKYESFQNFISSQCIGVSSQPPVFIEFSLYEFQKKKMFQAFQ